MVNAKFDVVELLIVVRTMMRIRKERVSGRMPSTPVKYL